MAGLGIWPPTRRKFISTSASAGTGMHLIEQIALRRAEFTLAWWHLRTQSDSQKTLWASHAGQHQIFNDGTGQQMRCRVYNGVTPAGGLTFGIGEWHQFTFQFGDNFGPSSNLELRRYQDGVESGSNESGGSTGGELFSLGTHWFMGDDSATADTDDGYRGEVFDFMCIDGIWTTEQLSYNNGRWVDIDENIKKHLYYRLDGQHADAGRDSSGKGNHFAVEGGGITLSHVDLPPGANQPSLITRPFPSAIAAGPLDNDLISSMHFQRFYEPIAMGA